MSDINNSTAGTSLKYRVINPEADEKLRKRCMDAAESKYGNPLPDSVHKRLEREMAAIETGDHASQYLIGAMLAEQSMSEGYPVATRGTVGSALVSHLCGITAVNPLPAHYWCPNCHHFELYDVQDYKIMGYDLPDKTCPECGKILNAEGADIEPEVLMGIKLEREPDIILNVAAEVRPKLVSFLKDTFGEDCVFRAGVKAVLEDGNIRRNTHPGGVFIIPTGTDIRKITDISGEIPEDDFGLPVTERDYHEIDGTLKKYDILTLPELSMLAELERHTGVSAAQVKTNDKAILNVFWQVGRSFLPGHNELWTAGESLQNAVIRKLKPGHFSDLVRIMAMMHGVQVWRDNAELLLRSGHELRDCISTRDDVMQKLLAVSIDRARAYEIMNNVRKGRGLTKEMECDLALAGIPDWFIESCNKIVYLYPKAHVTDYTLLYWKLAYYRLHFPEEYEKVVAATREKTGTVP